MRSAALVVLVLALAGCARSTPIVDEVQSAEVSREGRLLTVVVLHGTCEEGARRLTIEETPMEVRIRSDGARALSGTCVDMGVHTQLSARLDKPLGDRLLVDVSDGRPVAP